MDTNEYRRVAEAAKSAKSAKAVHPGADLSLEEVEFAETFGPPTVLAILDEVDRLRSAVIAYRSRLHSIEESRPLCPDCRDKCRGEPCLRCQVLKRGSDA